MFRHIATPTSLLPRLPRLPRLLPQPPIRYLSSARDPSSSIQDPPGSTQAPLSSTQDPPSSTQSFPGSTQNPPGSTPKPPALSLAERLLNREFSTDNLPPSSTQNPPGSNQKTPDSNLVDRPRNRGFGRGLNADDPLARAAASQQISNASPDSDQPGFTPNRGWRGPPPSAQKNVKMRNEQQGQQQVHPNQFDDAHVDSVLDQILDNITSAHPRRKFNNNNHDQQQQRPQRASNPNFKRQQLRPARFIKPTSKRPEAPPRKSEVFIPREIEWREDDHTLNKPANVLDEKDRIQHVLEAHHGDYARYIAVADAAEGTKTVNAAPRAVPPESARVAGLIVGQNATYSLDAKATLLKKLNEFGGVN
ncbi:hypothetical protein BC938DRAFT_475024 [Jimgerdemannia flammicorona]|uniref:Uncharacterized protein n=1 Tax=Jimgerdemannia flammicorona TaxID=994334 RepID=A0A433QS23_9FUNG|nr:hypothetical protein BC938DRAFT_475024 [Jimgerdemannia flammicorona]